MLKKEEEEEEEKKKKNNRVQSFTSTTKYSHLVLPSRLCPGKGNRCVKFRSFCSGNERCDYSRDITSDICRGVPTNVTSLPPFPRERKVLIPGKTLLFTPHLPREFSHMVDLPVLLCL